MVGGVGGELGQGHGVRGVQPVPYLVGGAVRGSQAVVDLGRGRLVRRPGDLGAGGGHVGGGNLGDHRHLAVVAQRRPAGQGGVLRGGEVPCHVLHDDLEILGVCLAFRQVPEDGGVLFGIAGADVGGNAVVVRRPVAHQASSRLIRLEADQAGGGVDQTHRDVSDLGQAKVEDVAEVDGFYAGGDGGFINGFSLALDGVDPDEVDESPEISPGDLAR